MLNSFIVIGNTSVYTNFRNAIFIMEFIAVGNSYAVLTIKNILCFTAHGWLTWGGKCLTIYLFIYL